MHLIGFFVVGLYQKVCGMNSAAPGVSDGLQCGDIYCTQSWSGVGDSNILFVWLGSCCRQKYVPLDICVYTVWVCNYQ